MKLNDLLIPREGELDIQKLTFDYVRHADQTAARIYAKDKRVGECLLCTFLRTSLCPIGAG